MNVAPLPPFTIMSGEQCLLAWKGPDPRRIDAASVRINEDGLIALGTSCAPDHALTYRLDAAIGWATRSFDVRCQSGHGDVRLRLSRDRAGSWTARRWTDGRRDDCDLPDLAGALDVDLAQCPLTNTMPIRRTRLLERPDAREWFVMAWISVPDLRVHASRQHYGPAVPTAEAGADVRFQSEGFETTIRFDADGLVVSYPGIGERLNS